MFPWGASTAAYQVEGGNINADVWALEHLPHTAYREPSGDACDFHTRFAADLALLAGLGLNVFRPDRRRRVRPSALVLGESARRGLPIP